MYARSIVTNTLLPLALLLGTARAATPASAQLIEGIEGWSDAIIGLRTARWTGARVPTPVPAPRPDAPVRIDSPLVPISVHAAEAVPLTRVRAVLEAAEAAHVLLAAAGFLTSFGDAGAGGTGSRDIYLVDGGPLLEGGAGAALDASANFSGLDGARSFALVDARLPHDRLRACTAHALLEALLFELDPAEAAVLRRASAAYFAALVTGEPGCDATSAPPSRGASPFRASLAITEGAAWLARLGARQDGGRGTFLFDMWQFARQRTWEGRDLRASPDLLEAIAKALELQHDELARVASQLADRGMLEAPLDVPTVRWDALPVFAKPQRIEPLGSRALRIALDPPQPGRRLRAWATRDPGGARVTLAATRLAGDGRELARLEAGPRDELRSQLSVELDADTRAVLISATHVGDGRPDLDEPLDPTRVALTIDAAP